VRIGSNGTALGVVERECPDEVAGFEIFIVFLGGALLKCGGYKVLAFSISC
jgi:hypothetical protein